ncbi:MAG: hypothetical protein Q4D90_11560 [bacterium]|nr:hypothetical protein [bacterium]
MASLFADHFSMPVLSRSFFAAYVPLHGNLSESVSAKKLCHREADGKPRQRSYATERRTGVHSGNSPLERKLPKRGNYATMCRKGLSISEQGGVCSPVH